MAFKVRATVLGAMGDESKYPCHFNYKKGDEIIWTGAQFIGRICPAILTMLAQKVRDMYNAGPRWVESGHYHPFWHAPPSVYDPSLKKYDGIGFRPVLKTIPDEPYSMTMLRPPNSFLWPPHPVRDVAKGMGLMCPDLRTAMTFKLEAYDFADDGDAVTYFRRVMVMLDRILDKPGIAIQDIMGLFSQEEIEQIYPPLSPIMVQCLIEDIELIGYVTVANDKVTATPKAVDKVKEFKTALSAEERAALRV